MTIEDPVKRNALNLNRLKVCRTARSEFRRPSFKIIDNFDPFDEPDTSFAQSIKMQINDRFSEKLSHKMK
jgi:hypothetical protein